MKKLITTALCALATLMALPIYANDGVYYLAGNQLVPMEETDISVTKEILTISLGDDGMADVDVYYEFHNAGPAKQILMGFEADAPYNAGAVLSKEGIHPYMHDFCVEMNGQRLAYSNGIYASKINERVQPLDLKDWKPSEYTDDVLYNAELDSTVAFSYVYKFCAAFRHGQNIVHHTYRYNMSMSVCTLFNLNYKLTPATRWAAGNINDFTLTIKTPNTAKHFIIDMSAFGDRDFQVEKGTGKIRRVTMGQYSTYNEVSLRNGAVSWHATHFRPQEELTIYSADMLQDTGDRPFVLGCFYDRSAGFRPELCHFMDGEPLDARILRNLPYAHRGYVFHDKTLRQYFSNLWWYMPDATWKASTQDFTPLELEFIKGGKK